MKTLCICLMLLFLASCRGTPTPAGPSVGESIVHPDALPAGFGASTASTELPSEVIDGLPPPRASLYQPLEKDGAPAGFVVYLQYGNQDDVWKAGTRLYKRVNKKKIRDVFTLGDSANVAVKTDSNGQPFADLAYTRCGGVFYIRLLDVSETTTIDDYAKAIDERTKVTICSLPFAGPS